jgi:hypothetical protein
VLPGHDHLVRAVAAAGSERLAQTRHVHLHRLRGGGGWALAPQLVDQAVGAERLVRVEQQQRKQRALLAPPKR